MTGGMITQTAALAAIREVIDKDANYITAGGSLPSCSQRMWTTDKRCGYHAEYGYSCMGYEVAATLGVKMADPDNEVYAVVGDASFQMLHSEIMTIMQEKQKVNILVFDNCGFGCINNLEMGHGIGSIATEFRYSEGQKPCGDLIPVDYAKVGEGYGLKTYTCKTIQELKDALEDAKKQTVACLFDLKVIPKTMTDGYESWWNVGIATTSEKESVREACEGVMEGRAEARKILMSGVLSAGGTCLALTEAEMREHIVRSNPWHQSGAKYLCLNIIRFIIWWRVLPSTKIVFKDMLEV